MQILRPKKPENLIEVPLIPVRDVVVFPHNEIVLTLGRNKSIFAINSALNNPDKLIAIFTQKQAQTQNPQSEDIYHVGSLCVIERTFKSDEELNVLVKGVSRIKLRRLVSDSPYLLAEVEKIPDIVVPSEELTALSNHLTSQFKLAVNLGKTVEFMNFMKLMSGVSPAELANQIAFTLNIDIAKKQQLLEISDVKERLYKVNEYLAKEIQVLEIERKIASKTQQKFSKSMREAVLRERMQTIKQELGELNETEKELNELEKQIKKLAIPKKDKEKVLKELNRLKRMSPHNPEANYIRTWLETIIDLPWGKLSPDKVSLKKAEEILEAEHYGLKEVKERILEYLAVMKLKRKKEKNEGANLPTIICFAGPPGVGKTSLGRSIAKALKRKFVKVSLGGIRDEAEIRGHRRTYVGAMPGRIIKGILQAGSMNPVFMLDEIDKVGNDFRGDPSAALLEALDPEQNKDFSDHYLDMKFDLSKVMFIATANVLDTIPPALRDRLEVISFAGYTETEKYHIAKEHLLPKVREKNALEKNDLNLNKAVLMKIIKSYTREAGVRELERQLAKLARKIAKLKVARRKIPKITTKNLEEFLGPVKYTDLSLGKRLPAGIATGLAWTQAGGEVLFVEVSIMPGKGELQLTGQLGEVMQESAKAAMSYVRVNWKKLGLKKDFYKNIDIHIHVPEGAVPKDGPSAGVTMTTALVSALTGKRVKKSLGMTGEISLKGRVLEIGGLKEKVIAAHTYGLKEIVLPKANEKDLKKIPEEVKSKLKFYPVESLDEVLEIALVK